MKSFTGASAGMAHRLERDNMGNLGARALSTLVLGPLVLGVVYAGGWLFFATMGLAAALALREWLQMIAPGRLDREFLLSCGALVLVLAADRLVGAGSGALLALVLGGALGAISGPGTPARPGNDRALAALGVPYVGISCVTLVWLRDVPHSGLTLIVFLLLTVWANDIGAYVAGKSIGGPRLAPTISPSKTWAGFIGGVIAAGIVGGLLALAWGADRPVVAASLGAVLGVVGQGGDLFESAIKRRYNVKDSGRLIPGHGGLLDRIDGLVAAAPVLAAVQGVFGDLMGWGG